MLNKLLRILGVIELILFVAAIILYFATAGSNDFSGLVILYPIYGMFGIGLLALVVFIASLVVHKPSEPQHSSSPAHKLLLLTAVSAPILYVVSNFTAGYGNRLGLIAFLYLSVIGALIFISHKNVAVDIFLYLILILLPILLVIYASHINDPNIYSIAKTVAALLVISTILSIVVRFTHSFSAK